VNVIKRVGVAVVVDIPGLHKSALVVDQIGFDTQNGQGATFAVKINNIGNTLTNAEGNFLIKDAQNNTLSSLPINIEPYCLEIQPRSIYSNPSIWQTVIIQ